MRALKLTFFVPLFGLCLVASQLVGQDARARRHHDDPQWPSIEEHLPDPATATATVLEQQADLLRVRKFPEDALEFYGYAMKRGGVSANLLNKIGLTQLELRNVLLAQGYFRQATRLDRRSPQGWNNLAATEYLEREYSAAVNDYKKAVKLDRGSAVFHANLSTAYFEIKDYKRGRREADAALRIDPAVYGHAHGAGVVAHVLSLDDRARYAFEMAKLYAQHGQEAEMLHSLAMACEHGFDIAAGMAKDPALAKYRDDPRVALVMVTAKSVRQSAPSLAANAVPRLEGTEP
jgi:tetratricopeptide (TPR) repeat protein